MNYWNGQDWVPSEPMFVATLARLADPRGALLRETAGLEVFLSVSNGISFAGRTHPTGAYEELFPWEDDFSSVMRINAVLAQYPAEYAVEIFNSSDQRLYHTPANEYSHNGLIDFEWDLLQDDHTYYAGEQGDHVYARITSYYPSQTLYQAGAPGSGMAGPVSSPKSKYTAVNRYPDQGTWIIALQRIDPDNELVPIFDTLANAWGFVMQQNGNYALPLPGQGRAERTAFQIRYNGSSSESIQAQTADWDLIRAVIPDPRARNLWLLAHGSPSTMGGDYDIGEGAIVDPRGNSRLTAAWVHGTLGFGCFLVPNHYYRFVFLDGCETASGRAWPAAFGFHPLKISAGSQEFESYYLDKNRQVFRRRPSAFCGWAERKLLGFIGTPRTGFKEYRTEFRKNWLDRGRKLAEAHKEARDSAKMVDGSDDWGRNLEIFGYQDLLFDEYNYRWF